MEDYLIQEFLKHLCAPLVDCSVSILIDDSYTISDSQFKRIPKMSGSSDVILVVPDRLRYYVKERLRCFAIWAQVDNKHVVQLDLSHYDLAHPEDVYVEECYFRDVYISNFNRMVQYIKKNPTTCNFKVDNDLKTITYKLTDRLTED